ncbi:hypothetical protein AeMF1_016421 [Aphanomyces euteiches]|nr:hypothetical protein AeMF1_016421 [Aphanomyces euteiches]
MQDGGTSSGLNLHLEMIEPSSLECNLHGLMTARLHSLNRSFADTTMMKLALFAALLALTTAAPARPQLRGHGAGGGGGGGYGTTADAKDAESIERRRLHDLWYYAPHADSVHPKSFLFTPVLPAQVRPDGQEIEHSIHDRRLHDLWYYAPHPLSPKQEPKRRLHDLWYYAPHINKQEPKPSPERQLKMQAPAQDRDRIYPLVDAGDIFAESPSVSESDEAIESLSQKVPYGF